jgi:thioredoxin reductase
MRAWQEHMPKGMFLKSTFGASNLSAPGPGNTLVDYCRKVGAASILDDCHPVPRDLFVEYALGFQRRYVKTLEQKTVQEVALAADGFKVSVDDETLHPRFVIVASGHVGFADVPRELSDVAQPGDSPASLVSHSSKHADFARFAGASVAVIGAGQSALESAALLRESGAEVHLIVRGRSIHWGGQPYSGRLPGLHRLTKPESPLGTGWSLFVLSQAPQMIPLLPTAARLHIVRIVLGPAGAWWLHDRVADRVNVSLETIVQSARILTDGVSLDLRHRSGTTSTLKVDHVLAATGYRVDVERITFLDPALRAKVARVRGSAAPRLSSSFESSIPGLYFAGLSAASTFGPLLRFVCGSQFAARTISRAITSGK